MAAIKETIDTVSNLMEVVEEAKDRGISSLSEYTKQTLITSRVYIEDVISGEPTVMNILKLCNQIYAGMVFCVLGLNNVISGGRTVRQMLGAVATEDIYKSASELVKGFGDAEPSNEANDNQDMNSNKDNGGGGASIKDVKIETDASKLFLSDREQDTGTVIIPTVEGTRPLLVELQALVAPTPYVPPRRTADSVDIKRIQLLLAVLEKRVHLSIGACDVYVKVAGGIRIDEPAADLGLCVAMASSFANRLVRPQTIIFGEVGLSGEVRAVSQAESRISEAKRLGFKAAVLPMKNCRQLAGEVKGIELYGAETLSQALKLAMPK